MKRYQTKRTAKRQLSHNKTAPLPQGTFTADITDLLTDGRGLSIVDDKSVMIAGALPGERVEFRFTKQTKQYAEGELINIVNASPFRVAPHCPVFDQCGGCALQHLDAEKQLALKHQQLIDKISHAQIKSPKHIAEPLSASHWGYRQRARVGLKWQPAKRRVDIGFRGRASSHIVPTDACPILAPALSALFSPLAACIATLSAPDSITHVEMTCAEQYAEPPNHQPQVALTFRHVEPLTDDDKVILAAFAEAHRALVYLQGSNDGSNEDSVIGLHHEETLSYYLSLGTYPPLRFDFLPYHFTQVNFAMNRKMVAQALGWLDLTPDDTVLDLFCGLGNFTLPIAQRVATVVGVEGAKSLVDWAKRNADNNGMDNAEFYQADLTQNTQMMAWRVKHHYNKILLDPPRAGAADIMPLLLSLKPARICYVSCHSATLMRDIKHLVDNGYRLETIGVMDMFPHTAHVEAMALLTKP